jgi:hypothetical protein
MAQPPFSEMMTRYLHRQTQAYVEGLGHADATSDVVPHEAATLQPVDPRLAWSGAIAAAGYFRVGPGEAECICPPDWPTLVASRPTAAAIALCQGNFPQLVRDFRPLLHSTKLSEVRATPQAAQPAPDLMAWVQDALAASQPAQQLLAVGILRLTGQYSAAEEQLSRTRGMISSDWQAAWANEQAALAWHSGRAEEAIASWNAQAVSLPVLFNRGMAALFSDRIKEARPLLSRAVSELAEEGPWHHLAGLYLALAEIRA